MIKTERYRHSIINMCDLGTEYAITDINGATGGFDFGIGAHTINAGDYVLFEDCDPGINGVQKVTSVAGGFIFIETERVIDNSIHGTITKLTQRFVNPLNFFTTKFVWDKESDQVFFRKKLSGKLKFNDRNSENNDWTYFRDQILPNECCEVKYLIEKKCDGVWVEDWKGSFTHNMGRWNLSHCHVEIDIEPDDNYTCLLESKGDDVNVLPETEKHPVSISAETSFEETECCLELESILMGLFTTADPGCGIYYDQNEGPVQSTLLEHLLPEFDGDEVCTPPKEGGNWGIKKVTVCDASIVFCIEGSTAACLSGMFCITYIREVLVTFDIAGVPQQPAANGGNAWNATESLIIAGYPATKWVRNPSTTWDENVFNISCGDDCYIFDYSDAYPAPTPVVYDDGRDFADVCDLIVTKWCGSISGIRSDFFEINPPGDTPGYVAGINYVTGAQNKLANMLLMQMSDFLDPDADQSAFIGNISFSDLANLWRIAFNAFWFVDADGYVRVEHISWFNRIVNVDTTSGTNNIRMNKGLKEFTFDRDKIPIREKFTMRFKGGIDFFGLPIKYDSLCADPRVEENFSLDWITTDVNFLTSFGTDNDLESFVLICLDPDDTTTIDREIALMSGLELNNAHLSWANLHYNYHRHNRWLLDGEMNGINETFISAKRTKRQVPIRYDGGCCAAINPLTDLVTTELGNGEIDKMEKDNRDEIWKFELLFD